MENCVCIKKNISIELCEFKKEYYQVQHEELSWTLLYGFRNDTNFALTHMWIFWVVRISRLKLKFDSCRACALNNLFYVKFSIE